MTTVFLQRGSIYVPKAQADLNVSPVLPGGNYIVIENPDTGELMFQQIESFSMPPKLYGDIGQMADRILTTYHDRPGSTGVLLAGEKGSGKTQLARLVAIRAASAGIPCIVINQPWVGDKFCKLIQSVTQPCIVLFDEFEKVYDEDEQKQVLTLFDGVFPSKKLFFVTCNDQWLVNDHMRNRPGRMYYMIEYRGVSTEFIIEYCNDVLNNKAHIRTIVDIASMFNEFNFDMLKAMVEELNRYNETPEQVLRILNARPTGDKEGTYSATVIVKNKEIKGVWPTMCSGSPLSKDELQFSYEDKNHDSVALIFRPQHLTKFDSTTGQFEYYIPEKDARVMLVRTKSAQTNFMSLLA